PFVINEIVNKEIASNPKTAEKLIDRQDPRIWDIVESVIDGYPVLMNRAPTLHRLGIQAFKPKLVEGRAMRLHPLVCTAFNADFDGDQMAVHVPLSEEARAEALVMMLGSNNILGPKDGKPIVTPGQDMVMGNFYLTMEETAEEFYQEADRYNAVDCPKSAAIWTRYGDNEGHVFGSINEILMAYQTQQIHLHSRIAIPARALKKESFTEEQNKKYLLTTVGKVIFNNMFPTDFPFLNEVSAENFVATPERFFLEMGKDVKEAIKSMPVTAAFKKKDLGKIIGEIFKRYSTEKTSEILDQIKDMGFQYSTVAGVTVSLSDIEVAPHKEEHVEYGKQKAEELKTLRKKGKLTMMEWERHLNKLWADVKDDIAEELLGNLPRKNPISMMARSGARGNTSNFTQLAGMRGLMAKPNQSKSAKGEYVPTIIEVPIYSCFREGLNVSEFFISTHGVRKGLTDTALKTAESGYLTRRLVDVAQDVIVKQEDCGTDKGYWVEAIVDRKTNTIIESLFDRLVGRYSKQEITDPKTGEVILESDEFITDALAQKVVDAGVEGMYIRSAFTCKSIYGVCKKCYGRNMATGKDVEVGEAVGIMAAQSIGEPGTQLTMRTFHTGGVASADGGDITQGLPRVEELFEARCPKGVAVLAQITGEITDVHQIDTGYEVTVSNDKESIVHKVTLIQAIRPWMKVGAHVEAGDKITEGQVDPKELLKVAGVRQVQNYILKEVKKVYQSQGIEISDKHVEVMIRQMLRKVVVLEGNDTHLNPGVQISLTEITKINRKALLSGQVPATFKPVLLGISKASVETDSFLSAASFQETTKVLTDAAIKGKKDYLIGLKENVIIGKLIPAGTGVGDERPMNLIIGEKAKELKEIREERNHKEDDDNFMAYVPAGPERLTTEMVQQIMDGEDTTLEQPAVEVQE
ncbi:MAG: DNA-directed RNA polymerase subunit beta', partial [[Clostridium] innocuum]